MIDKFITEFDQFAKHEKLSELDDECKIALFSIFCKIMEQRKTNVPASKEKPKRGNSRSASEAQLNLIGKFIKRGHLGKDFDLNSLNVAEASLLIDEGITNQQKSKKKATAKPDGGKIQGAYNHESGGADSEAHFWE